ncbi:MAG: site-specific integrase [Mangrovibacterium sp.]
MRSTFSIFFYINRSKIKADGTTVVMCRISIDGKNSTVTTGIYCRTEDWDCKKQEIGVARENNRLKGFLQRVEHTYEDIIKEQGVISAVLLKNTVTKPNIVAVNLLQAGEVERERLRVRSKLINSISSYHQSKITHKNLSDFVLSMGMGDILFTDITERFGNSFKDFLKQDLRYQSSHVNHCLRWLNRLIYIAVDQGILRANPMEGVKYEPKAPPQLRHIGRNELQWLMENPMPDQRKELLRRAFIFSVFTGLSYVDIRNLYPHHIGKTAEGRVFIRINRAKTNVEAFIPLHPAALQILALYNKSDDSQPVFPLPKRDMIWPEVHQIGFIMGRTKNLSYHCARHSFATLMLSAGIPIESISKMMGHTNISTTQVYAKVTDDKISEDMDNLIARRKLIGKAEIAGNEH